MTPFAWIPCFLPSKARREPLLRCRHQSRLLLGAHFGLNTLAFGGHALTGRGRHKIQTLYAQTVQNGPFHKREVVRVGAIILKN